MSKTVNQTKNMLSRFTTAIKDSGSHLQSQNVGLDINNGM